MSSKTLENFLKSHSKEVLRELPNTSLKKLNGLERYGSLIQLISENQVRHNLMSHKDYDTDLLVYLEKNRTKLWYKVLSKWILIICVLFLIIFPLLIENYWFYFSLLLIPITALSISPVKTFFKPLFLIITMGLTAYSLYVPYYEIFGIIIPVLLIKFSTKCARKIFQKEIINSSKENNLFFKFLFITGTIVLYNHENDELIYY